MTRDMTGTPVTMENGQLKVPNDPVIHYIEGDGIGVDITPVMIDVVNAAVEKPTAVRKPSSGRKSWLAKKPSTPPANGCPKPPWTP